VSGPEVIASWQQAKVNTKQERAKENQRREKAIHTAEQRAKERALPNRKIPVEQEIGFAAEKDGAGIGPITVLAGEGAPTVTGGFVKVQKVQRFQRVSLTIPEGYDPYVMTVPILFDAVALTKDRPDIEKQIVILEEMAGRPKGGAFPGAPPQVEVFTADSTGKRTNLMPLKFQEDPELLWYITSITWDSNPLRNPEGDRIRQAATVELTEISQIPQEAAEDLDAQKKIAAKRPDKIATTPQMNTIKKVAVALAGRFHNKALAVRWNVLLAANHNLTTNADRELRPGTKVRIPADFWLKVAR
jgi:hypothetical protein